MKEISLFSLIFRQTHMRSYLLAFIPVFLVCCGLIWALDKEITSYGDALWYGFMLVTTIGFGDLTVTSPLARIVSVFLGLYGILMIGFICGVGASWLFEKVRSSRGESVSLMLYQLEHLETLSDEQVAHLQKQVRDLKPQTSKKSPGSLRDAHETDTMSMHGVHRSAGSAPGSENT